MQLGLLCNKPNAWPNSLVRDMLPDPLRDWLDRQEEQARRDALRTPGTSTGRPVGPTP